MVIMDNGPGINIVGLPCELLKLILGYLSFDEISKVRSVCKSFDVCAQELLNHGFQKSFIRYSRVLQNVKDINNNKNQSNLILKNAEFFTTSLDMTILDLTYKPYIRLKLCCFIPGKVIDKLNNLSRLIMKNVSLNREYDYTREFKDFEVLHRKAVRHFVASIVPFIEQKQLEKDRVIHSLEEQLFKLKNKSYEDD